MVIYFDELGRVLQTSRRLFVSKKCHANFLVAELINFLFALPTFLDTVQPAKKAGNSAGLHSCQPAKFSLFRWPTKKS